MINPASQPALFLLYAGYSYPPWPSAILPHFSYNQSNSSSPAPNFKTFQVFLICTKQRCAPNAALKFQSNLPVQRVFFLLNAAFAMAILDLISRVHLASFVTMLPKQLKYSIFSSCFWFIIIYWGWVKWSLSQRNFFLCLQWRNTKNGVWRWIFISF